MKKILAMWLGFCTVFLMLTGCSDPNEAFQQKEDIRDSVDIQAVCIDVKDRRIEIEPSQDQNIRVFYSESEREGYDISVNDGIYRIEGRDNKSWTDRIGANASKDNRTLRLEIPTHVLASLEITTTNEDIVLSELMLSDRIAIDINNGNFQFGRLDVGKELSLKAKNGDITGTLSGRSDDFTITTHVKKGDSNLPKQMGAGEKRLDVSVNNGNIKIEIE